MSPVDWHTHSGPRGNLAATSDGEGRSHRFYGFDEQYYGEVHQGVRGKGGGSQAEKDRKESEAREEARNQEFEAFKKESEAREEAFKKESEAREEALKKESEAREEARKQEAREEVKL